MIAEGIHIFRDNIRCFAETASDALQGRRQPDGYERAACACMNKRTVGSTYEKLAGAFLEQNGYRILEYNYRCRKAEIDLIAREGKYLVFVEVKYRSSSCRGTGAEAVDGRKMKRIRFAALLYLTQKKMGFDIPVRFDVVWIEDEKMHLIKNAFAYK